jgi:hypothetical protein
MTIGPEDFTPVKANAEDLRRLAERVAAIEQRIDDQDDRRHGSTTWLIREIRTVALMTPHEGIATLRILLNQYDKKQRPTT